MSNISHTCPELSHVFSWENRRRLCQTMHLTVCHLQPDPAEWKEPTSIDSKSSNQEWKLKILGIFEAFPFWNFKRKTKDLEKKYIFNNYDPDPVRPLKAGSTWWRSCSAFFVFPAQNAPISGRSVQFLWHLSNRFSRHSSLRLTKDSFKTGRVSVPE